MTSNLSFTTRTPLRPAAAFGFATCLLCSCYVNVTDQVDDDEWESTSGRSTGASRDSGWLRKDLEQKGSVCSSSERSSETPHQTCYASSAGDEEWNVSCRSADCVAVPVHVQFLMSELPQSAGTVQVEAFDNPYFYGAPQSSVMISGYRPDKPGYEKSSTLYLGRGEYFVRAYLTDRYDQLSPYEYQGMELVSDHPVAIHGALSGAEKIVIQGREKAAPEINLQLDKLFKKPEAAEPSDAHLRLQLRAQSAIAVPPNRDILIQLRTSEDLSTHAEQSFRIPSERLLVSGSAGETEHLLTDLAAGQYTLLVFIDNNGNGYHDAGEALAMPGTPDSPQWVTVSPKRTVTLNLEFSEAAGSVQ